MGAGRKTETIWLKEKPVTQAHGTSNFNTTARNLRKNDLGGVIFGCRHSTIKECYFKQLFGLPAAHFSYVRNICPGLPLFLFNYSDRKLHGIFEAASYGKMNINPYAWTEDESEYTLYPAQVRIRVRKQCQPLVEDQFGPIITENYYESKLFWFELDRVQTEKLISLFSSFGAPVPTAVSTVSTAISTNTEKWSSLFNGSSSVTNKRQGGEISIESDSSNDGNLDRANTEWESSVVGKIQKLGIVPDDWDADDNEPKDGGLKQNFGLSYSSVVRNIGASAANSSQSNKGTSDGTNSGQQRRLLEVRNKKESTDHCHETLNIGWAFPSVSRNTSSAPHSDNADVGSGNRIHQGSGGAGWNLQAIDHKKSGQTFKTDLVDQTQSCDHSYSSVVRTVGISHPPKNRTHFFKDSTTDDARKEVQDIKLPATGFTNLSSSDESNLELKLPLFGEKKGKLLEDVFDDSENSEDYMDLSLISEVLNSPNKKEGITSFTHCPPNDPTITCHSENEGLVPHLDYGSHPSDAAANGDAKDMIGMVSNEVYSPKTANILEMESSSIHSIMAMLLDEVKELRSSNKKQDRKINLLEQDLVKSRLEIQLLKDRCKALECQPFEKCGNVEQEESESTNDPHPSFEESILLVGGFDGCLWLSAMDCYHPSIDHMESGSSMHLLRSYASAANLNGEVYVFGGVYDNVWYDEVESYNPVTNQWTYCPSLNQKKGNLVGVSFNDKIYAVGGGNGSECFSAVEIFDSGYERWIPSKSMLRKRFAPAAAEINGAIYVVGGYDGKNYLKSMERFDPRERSWTRLESMSTKRGCHSLAVLGEKLFAMGGYDGQKIVSTVEVFDPRKGSWMMGNSMNECRGYSASCVIGDAIYVIGGLKDNDEILDTVECYKEGFGWQSTNLKAIGKRCFFSAIVL